MNYEPWSELEDAVVMDKTLTARQAALKVGRTFFAVKVRRCRLSAQNGELSGGVGRRSLK